MKVSSNKKPSKTKEIKFFVNPKYKNFITEKLNDIIDYKEKI